MRPLKPCRKCGGERLPTDVVPGARFRCWVCRVEDAFAVIASPPAPAPPKQDRRLGPKRNKEREVRVVQLYTTGHTLQQIGTVYGITRERVRQILKKAGFAGSDGGVAKRKQKRLEAKAQARLLRDEAKAQAAFGCGFDELLKHNDGKRGWTKGSKSRAFIQQRRAAQHRGIEWLMAFPEWCRVWDESGHWNERGRTANGYVMARRQDFGPYAAWNVYITTLAQNVVDYQAELKRRGVECPDGYRRLPERAAQLEAA